VKKKASSLVDYGVEHFSQIIYLGGTASLSALQLHTFQKSVFESQ